MTSLNYLKPVKLLKIIRNDYRTYPIINYFWDDDEWIFLERKTDNDFVI